MVEWRRPRLTVKLKVLIALLMLRKLQLDLKLLIVEEAEVVAFKLRIN